MAENIATQTTSLNPVDGDAHLGRVDEWRDNTGKVVAVEHVYPTTITCSISRLTFASGDPVEATIHLENRNQIKQTLNCCAIERDAINYGYRVTRDGHLLSPLNPNIKESAAKYQGGSWPGAWSNIPPGGSFHVGLPLSSYFDLTQAGHYKVNITTPYDWSMLLYPSSCQVGFDVFHTPLTAR